VFPFFVVVYESVRTWIGKFKKSPRPHDMDEEEPPVDKKEIYLSDLSNIQPKFISNITVNDWQIGSRQGPCHHLIAFSTEDVRVIGKYVDEEGKSVNPESVQLFKPEHMPLSQAMAISGAALSFDMGSYESSLDMILDLLSLLGLGMGAELPSDQVNFKEKSFREACKMVCTLLIFGTLGLKHFFCVNNTALQAKDSISLSWSHLSPTGHFRVPKTLTFKMRLGAQPFL